MSRHGKRYFNALKKAPKKAVSLEEAVKFVKDNPGAKFDETVDVYFESDLLLGGLLQRVEISLSVLAHSTTRFPCCEPYQRSS